MYVAHILGTAPGIAHGQNTFEGVAKFLVENRIDYWIEGRVRVAQPGEYLEGLSANAGLAKGGRDVHTEERHPAYQEHAHNDAHSHRCLVIRHVIRRTVMQIAHLELLWRILGSSYALVALLLGHLARSCHRLDGLHMLLGVAVETVCVGEATTEIAMLIRIQVSVYKCSY